MSRIVYFDCSSGVSGDMLLGALVDLGVALQDLRETLASLPLAGYRLEQREVRRAGIRASKVDVIVEAEDGEKKAHAHGHGPKAGAPHGHRGLEDVLELLDKSRLEAPVRDTVAGLFRRLAEAEAAVHGVSVEAVHFHEVGAVDSIVDIVGGVWGLRQLGAERFASSPLNLGSGTATMEHGTLPVPAPATARLTAGVPVYGEGQGELTTPTGALLVTAHATSYGALPLVKLDRVGYGAGSREVAGRPNVLRLMVGELTEGGAAGDRVTVIETEIDDMSPQFCGPLVEKLLGAGALDAYFTPIFMKKGRPGILVTALVDAAAVGAVEEVLFRETTTLGVRRSECQRTCLAREVVTVETAYGPIRVKRAVRDSRTLNAQPEFDDCERAAGAHSVPAKEVWAAALTAYRLSQGRSPAGRQ
jgi:uncharacterized protein (TIGR00299 family) protein